MARHYRQYGEGEDNEQYWADEARADRAAQERHRAYESRPEVMALRAYEAEQHISIRDYATCRIARITGGPHDGQYEIVAAQNTPDGVAHIYLLRAGWDTDERMGPASEDAAAIITEYERLLAAVAQ